MLKGITEAEAFERRSSSMTTAPVKSQPLHNFSLPFLKWGKNQMNNHRCRKLVDTSSRESPSRDHRSSASEAESEGGGSPTETEPAEPKTVKNPGGSRSSKNRFSFANCSSSTTAGGVVAKVEKNLAASESLSLRKEGKGESEAKKKANVVVDEGEGGGGEILEESVQKPWNLRPRRAVVKAPNEIVGGASKTGELQEKAEHLPKSGRLRSFAETQNVEKKEKKRRLLISLTREEIDEDFFAITGSKASRRPKKRARNIQKQVDNVFPGLWLVGLTADSYSIPDVPAKK